MRGNLFSWFAVVVIHLEFLLFVDRVHYVLADDNAFLEHGMAQQFTNVCAVADGFGDNVTRTFECVLHARDTFSGVDKSRGKCFERRPVGS